MNHFVTNFESNTDILCENKELGIEIEKEYFKSLFWKVIGSQSYFHYSMNLIE